MYFKWTILVFYNRRFSHGRARWSNIRQQFFLWRKKESISEGRELKTLNSTTHASKNHQKESEIKPTLLFSFEDFMALFSDKKKQSILQQGPLLLDLSQSEQGIKDSGAKQIADLLYRCPSGTRLNLSNNTILNEGVMALLDKVPNGPENLEINLYSQHFSQGRINDSGFKKLAEILEKCPNGFKITLSDHFANSMVGPGFKALLAALQKGLKNRKRPMGLKIELPGHPKKAKVDALLAQWNEVHINDIAPSFAVIVGKQKETSSFPISSLPTDVAKNIFTFLLPPSCNETQWQHLNKNLDKVAEHKIMSLPSRKKK